MGSTKGHMSLRWMIASWSKASRAAGSLAVVVATASAVAGCGSHPAADSHTGVNHGVSSSVPTRIVYLPCCGLSGSQQDERSIQVQDYRPRMIALDATGSHMLQDMSWQVWNSVEAVGTGTADVDTCTPSCAGGILDKAPVTVTLSMPQECDGKWFWSQAVLHFPDSISPGEIRSDNFSFAC